MHTAAHAHTHTQYVYHITHAHMTRWMMHKHAKCRMCSSKSSRGGGPSSPAGRSWWNRLCPKNGKMIWGVFKSLRGDYHNPWWETVLTGQYRGTTGGFEHRSCFFAPTWMEKIFSSTNRFHCDPILKQSQVTHFHNQTCQEETPNVHKETMANHLDGWMLKQPRNWLKLIGKDTSLIPLKHGLNPTPFGIFQSMEWWV